MQRYAAQIIEEAEQFLYEEAGKFLPSPIEIIDDTPYYYGKKLLPFDLRVYQKRIFHKVFIDGIRKIFTHWSRRSGKDACDFSIIATLALQKKGIHGYMLPYNVTAKKVIWNNGVNINSELFFYTEFFPKSEIKSMNSQEMTIRLKNGSIIYICGTDNYDRLRGIFLTSLCLSEYAFGRPGVMNILSPVIAQANTIVLVNTTPSGYNFSWNKYLFYKTQESWYTELETCETLVDEDGNRYITDAMIQSSVEDGMSPGMIRQEFYCEPYLDANELYFAEEIEACVKDNRWYAKNLIIPGRKIHFALDLGLSALTVIIGFQITNQRKINVIYCYADSVKPWGFYPNKIIMAALTLGLERGTTYLPHDGAKRSASLNDIRTVEDDFNAKGIFTDVIERTPFKDDAISEAKKALNLTSFLDIDIISDDKILTQKKSEILQGIEDLRINLQSYKRAFNKATNEPTGKDVHDNASHYADAFQCLAAAYRQGIR